MYRISDTQIDFILNDIRARGVEMESLQQNLLDHICYIIKTRPKKTETSRCSINKPLAHFTKNICGR